MEIAFSLLLILIVPLILTYALMMLEPFAVTRVSIIGIALVWGIGSYWIADVIQSSELAGGDSLLSVALLSAPILEEFLKISFLLVVYHYTLARYSGDGVVYGFAVGSGFAIMENIEYLLGQPEIAFGSALTRIVSTGLFHASMTALFGAIVCGAIYYRRRFTYPLFAILFLFGIVAHHMFNLMAYLEEVLEDISALIQLGMMLFFIVLGLQYFIRWREQRRVKHDIDDELDATERVVLHHGADILNDLDK